MRRIYEDKDGVYKPYQQIKIHQSWIDGSNLMTTHFWGFDSEMKSLDWNKSDKFEENSADWQKLVC